MTYNFVQKVGNNYYLYRCTGDWDPAKKNSKQTREYVGPCDENGVLRESRRKRKDSKARPMTEDAEEHGRPFDRDAPFRTYRFGTYDVLYRMAKESGIVGMLDKAFGEETSRFISALSIAMVADRTSMRLVEESLDETYLREIVGASAPFSSPRISERLKSIGKDEASRLEYAASAMEGTDVVIFDTTVLTTESKGVELAVPGRKSKKTGLPQVNLGFVHSMDRGFPCHMKLFEGNVNDVTTVFNLAEEISDMCNRVVMMVMDRGFYSEKNIRKLYSEGHGFLMPVPSDRKLFKESISASVKDLSNPLNTFRFNGRTETFCDLRVENTIKGLEDKDGNPVESLRVLVFLNHDREKDESDTLYEDLDVIERRARGMDYSEESIDAAFFNKSKRRSLFEIHRDKDGKLLLRRKRNAITAAANRCGRLVLITSSDEPPREILSMYTGRDWVEKDYETLKDDLDGGLDYVQSDHAAIGLMFVQMIATSIRMFVSERIRGTTLGDMGIPMIIRRLNTLHIAVGKRGNRLSEVTKKHREIYEGLGLEGPAVPQPDERTEE